MIEVIVATINMRSGPGTEHPIVGRGGAGDLYPVVGRTDGSGSRLQIVLEDGSLVWVSGANTYTNLNVPCSAAPVGEDAVAAAIPTATSTPRRPSPTTPATANLAVTLPTPTRQAATPIPDTQGPIAVQAAERTTRWPGRRSYWVVFSGLRIVSWRRGRCTNLPSGALAKTGALANPDCCGSQRGGGDSAWQSRTGSIRLASSSVRSMPWRKLSPAALPRRRPHGDGLRFPQAA